MKFEKVIPIAQLRPYIKYMAISESAEEKTYKVFPSDGLVIGFQYRGNLNIVKNGLEKPLVTAGITGLQDTFRVFKNSRNIGTVLVFFTATGAASFFQQPINELYDESLSLDHFTSNSLIENIETQLAEAHTNRERIIIVERFLLSRFKEEQEDQLINQAVQHIYQAKGSVKIKQLADSLFISQSPFEKRFRRIVGSSPKKFASIIRFNSVLQNLQQETSFTRISYENNYFDQAHFIKDFKQFTGETPEKFTGSTNK